ncbi:uncharacterized protein L969DRAFT_95108 [Mixia osmundae IAM 14324]|uniref:Prefoldin subunit 6 n=1 Tax=Mixia osmundae (strain CBS 9802 / IAM 14324 / JCM 22182 / KY 12970) TaxID=764103 RepID=G7E757_MIXOS|nr:uncharacterized protein L969DRAFT_95108 [Mixia osmundae IAM 14324]KEI38947.1 hypothetical protein L969DRAFT_95108 [Mixia osmundae IAM 14324]GAA98667.1 hypothetical protein E5Q_05355 [Mixia osmundae IAM 14324]
MSLESKLQVASAEYQTVQDQLQNVVLSRQKLGAQLSENQAVKKEFDALTPNNTVYKLIGPGLIRQDQAEAKANVDKRLEFITSEIKRVEKQLEELQQKGERVKSQLVELQTQLQAAKTDAPQIAA